MNEDKNTYMPHSLIMENRSKMEITGVKNVESYDEETIVMDTCKGEMTIKGNGLNIEKFSVESTEIGITGEIIAVIYTNDRPSGGFFSKIFK
ncbi:MAG: sporulation protein YabP [Clostridia bacterium]|nr:sporulation protein YabP [Clostridia bacterium]MBQ7289202.1 sporulation protein YabP [Clostridia bacterium]